MGFLKKWISCILSFVAGVLGLSLSACTGMIVTGSISVQGTVIAKIEEITKAHKVLTDSKLYDSAKLAGIDTEFLVMKVFAIITLVASILLIVYSIIMLLKNLNVIKSDSIVFDIIGWTLVALFLIATIGLVVSSNVYANLAVELVKLQVPAQYLPVATFDVVGKIGLYQPFMLGTSIVLALATAVFALIKRKDA